MSRPDVEETLSDVLLHARQIEERIVRYFISKESVTRDSSHADLILMPLCQIGEAVQRNREALVEACPEMPWHQTAGLRNVIVHGHAGVDADAVWATATRDIPQLVTFCGGRLGEGR